MKKLEKSNERVKQFGEVFTPPALVEEMLDHLQFDWSDQTKTILEPAVGNGNFIEGIYTRLMIGLEGVITEPLDRHKHIFQHMIYAIDIQADNIAECIERFGLTDLKHHFVVADALTYHYRFDEWLDHGESVFIWPKTA